MITLDNNLRLEAERLVNSPLFEPLIAAIRKQFYNDLEATAVENMYGREAIYFKLKALDEIQATLRTHAQQAGKWSTK